MAICNLFKKLTKQTGEFLMFSQWVEDLTQNNAYGYNYRVVPGKFIAANIDFSNFNKGISDLNSSLPTYLQNYFENGCAIGKNYTDNDFSWDPDKSTNLFWNALLNCGLIHVSTNGLDHYINEINYVGDINIQSYDNKSGMGYSEIYCYIPNTACKVDVPCILLNESKTIVNKNNVLEGYKETDAFELNGAGIYGMEHNYGRTIDINYDDITNSKLNESSFDVNSIIILYDILSMDDKGESVTKYKNIPLGLYLPGCFKGTDVTNTITKWVSNSTIYNSGTSYGIKICSRFAAVPNSDNIVTSEVTSVDSDEYTYISQIMSGISDNLNIMKSITTDSIYNSDNLKDTLNMFQNSKTNVPYLLEINGTAYWFVNGKNTGYTINGSLEDIPMPYDDNYVEEEIVKLINEGIVLDIKTDIVWKGTDDYIRLYTSNEQQPTTMYVDWSLFNKYTTVPVSVQSLLLECPDKSIINLDEYSYSTEFPIHDVTEEGEYVLRAYHDGVEYSSPFRTKFYYPSYFGFVEGDNISDFLSDVESQIQKNNNIHKFTAKSQYIEFDFISTGDFLVYLYPKQYGDVEKIVFTNNMDNITDDFDKIPVTFYYLNRDTNLYEPVEYYLYCTRNYTGAGVKAGLKFTNIYNTIHACQVI